MKHGPKASDWLELPDFIKEKVEFVVESIGKADDLKVGNELSAYHFMAQTQEEYHYSSVGNRPNYCLDIMELILVHHNSQRLSFRHRIEGESDI